MSSQTTNLHLVKPSDNERADNDVINANMDTIDAAVGDVDVAQDGDLQSQIDALNNSVSQLLTVGTFTATSPAQEANAAWYCDVPITVPQGYEVVGVVGFSTGATAKGVMEARWLGATQGVVRVQGRTVYTDGGAESTVTVNVLFVRSA